MSEAQHGIVYHPIPVITLFPFHLLEIIVELKPNNYMSFPIFFFFEGEDTKLLFMRCKEGIRKFEAVG